MLNRLIFSLVFCLLMKSYGVSFDDRIEKNSEQGVHEEMSDGKLSSQQIAHFFEQGYVILQQCFSQEEVDEISECADRLQKEAEKLYQMGKRGLVDHKGVRFVLGEHKGAVRIERIVWAGALERRLLELGRQKKITGRVSQLLASSEADHLINQLHYKLREDGVKFSWHQDVQFRYSYDRDWQDKNQKGSFVQVIVAIDPMTDNGPIQIIPGLPKEGYIGLDQWETEEDREKWIQQFMDIQTAFSLKLDPGDVIFMHPYLIHKSNPNSSLKSRRILINGFSYPGANKRPYPGEGSAEKIVLK